MQEKIRFVELKDSTGILNIYTPYILDTTISFEYEPPSRLHSQNLLNVFQTSAVNTRI